MTIKRALAPVAALAAAALSLAACADNPTTDSAAGSNGSGGTNEVTVTITDDSCTVDPATVPSGVVTFNITNSGSAPNELEVLAENKLQIMSEQENIGPGTTASMTTALKEGTYFTACKPNMVGDFVGLTELDVSKGEEVTVSADTQKAEDEAITNYTSYVKDQVGQLVEATSDFYDAYTSGDVEKAKALYPLARQHYERIEPTAEAFGLKEAGDIDTALDVRIQDLAADAGKDVTDPDVIGSWTGWHRIEADLWSEDGSPFKFASDTDRKATADQLKSDTQDLYDLVYGQIEGADGTFKLDLANVATGASDLLEEVATSKIVGEEETFSHTDLYDFQANLEGAQVAYGNVADLVKEQDPDLAEKIETNMQDVEDLIAKYATGTDADGNKTYDDYSKIAAVQDAAGETPDDSDYTDAQREFSDAVNALSEPLSQVAGTVLH